MRRIQWALVTLILALLAIFNYVTEAPAHTTIISVLVALVALTLTGKRKEQNDE